MTQEQVGPAPRLISPNELQYEAKRQMLQGREPEDRNDWLLLVNFWAANVDPSLAGPICLLQASIFGCPLPEEDILQVVIFQVIQGS